AYVGRKVYFRGLIEYSNFCNKNCYYCGIRAGNSRYARYQMTAGEVMEAVDYALVNDYASIVIQSGERTNKAFVSGIESLLKNINRHSSGKIHVTLSLGEQTEETYKRWFDAGAHRYLLRIEVSNPVLYSKLHPDNLKHDYQRRLGALKTLRRVGYQVGTGVMIGLPFQKLDDLVDDLLFFREFDIDMAGMGPYIEHMDTPLYQYREQLLPLKERFDLSLKMVAILRIMMKDINIAATTAMQTIDPQGREKALMVGANVIMPNLTPVKYRQDYLLYENKPCLDEEAEECKSCLEARIHMAGDTIGYGEWGDSKHFSERNG
ncbi:MAG: [FeFe] hydrogenase H-cluster radical SAM maturase HydE, partial [Bacteroidota bacterium]